MCGTSIFLFFFATFTSFKLCWHSLSLDRWSLLYIDSQNVTFKFFPRFEWDMKMYFNSDPRHTNKKTFFYVNIVANNLIMYLTQWFSNFYGPGPPLHSKIASNPPSPPWIFSYQFWMNYKDGELQFFQIYDKKIFY